MMNEINAKKKMMKCITNTVDVERRNTLISAVNYAAEFSVEVSDDYDDYGIDNFCFIFAKIKNYLVNSGKYQDYEYEYFNLAEYIFNAIECQIFESAKNETQRKELQLKNFKTAKEIIDFRKYFQYLSGEN